MNYPSGNAISPALPAWIEPGSSATFGEEGVFDIVAVMGAYLVVSSVLNVFDVPAPN